MSEHELKFCDFMWQKRWNYNQGPASSITISNGQAMMVTAFGVVHFNPEDAPHIQEALEAAIRLLRENFATSNAEMAVREWMRQGRKIQAIKAYREIMFNNTGVQIGLKEAKDFVENLDRRNTR